MIQAEKNLQVAIEAVKVVMNYLKDRTNVPEEIEMAIHVAHGAILYACDELGYIAEDEK